MPRQRHVSSVPPDIRFSDFCRHLDHLGCEIKSTKKGHWKATRIRGNTDVPFGFATISGRRVKGTYIRKALAYFGVTLDEFMNA